MRASRLGLSVIVGVLCVGMVPAWAGVGVSPKIGTLGYGGDVTLGMSSMFGARIGYNTFSYDMSSLIEDDEGGDVAELDVDLSLETISALLDWHPGGGEFRLTVGGMMNNNEVALTATPGETVEIGDGEYTIESVDGAITFDSFAPYFGIGVGNAGDRSSRVHFAFDLGVMYQGEPQVSIDATASDPAVQGQLNADLDEEEQNMEDDFSWFKFYPVLSVGLSITF